MIRRYTRHISLAQIKKLISYTGILLFFILPFSLSGQAGQCNFGGCAGPGASWGIAQTTVSNTFVNSVAGTFGGEYNTYNVTAGQQYEWSLCTVDGAIASGDRQLTLKTTGNVNICYSDDRCGLLPKILWTATFTGQVRVLVNQYNCVTNFTSHTVRWRCVTCSVNCTGIPTAGVISIPSNSVCSGSNFTMTNTGATSGGGITYQWQSSPDNLTWTNITGANALSFTTSTTSLIYYRMVVTCSNSGSSTVSNVLTITPATCCTYTFTLNDSWGDGWNGNRIDLRIGTTVVASIGTGFTFGTTFTQTVQLISGTTYNLQWITGSWVNECGYNLRDQNNTIIHTFPFGGAPGNLVQFFTFTPSCVTNPPDPTGVTASANPICSGGSVQLSASGASGTVYWYSGSCGGTLVGTGNPISVSPTANTTYFARNFNGSSFSLNCASLAITVESAISNNTVSASQTLCANATPSTFNGSSPLGGSGTYTYSWESSTDNLSWTAIPATNSLNYTSGTVSSNTYFRRLVSAGVCPASTSTAIWIQSLPVLTPSVSISALPGTNICTGTNVTFTATPTNGGTAPSYQWSINGGPVGGNSSTFATTTLTNGNIVQVTLTSNANCASPTSVVSNSLTIQVNPIPPTPTIITNSPLCRGNTLSLSTTPTAFASYSWSGPSSYTSSNLINIIPNAGSNRSGVYSLIVTVAGCPSPVATSTVLVTDSVGSQVISASQTICSGSTPSILTGANPTGGTGIYNYTWDSSSDNVNWSVLTGETNQTYGPPILTSTVYYRRMVGSGLCPGNSSNSLMILVEQPLGNNSLTSAQTLCSGDVAASLTGSTPTGGSGSYTYVWGSSTNNLTWSAVPGATQIDYSPGSLTSTVYFRRILSGGVCPASTSQDVQIWVDPVLTNNTVQSNQTICAGSSPSPFTGSLPGGGNGIYTYQWESSSDNSSWSLVTGGTGQNYTEGVLSSDAYYRRIVVAGPCTSISASLSVRVEQGITGNTVVSDQTICVGNTASVLTGGVPSGGNGSYGFSWESSSNTLSWSTITGANAQDYSPGSPVNSGYYRRVVQSGVCSGITSTSVVLVVEPLITSNTILGSQTICATQTSQQLTGSAPTGGNGLYSYVWESSTDDSSWGVITGSTNQSLAGQVMTSSTYYRRVVSGGVCIASTSSSLLITVLPQLTGNTVLGDQTICTGNVAMMLTGGAPSGGAGSYGYQWEESLNNILFTTIGGAISQNYSPGLLGSSRYFRRVLSSGPCTDVSNTVLVIVDSPIGTNTIGSSQTICVGVVPSLLTGSTPSGGNGSYGYQWESSSNNSSWGPLSGETQVDHQPGSMSSTVWYRRTVGAGVCTPSTSGSIRILVNPVPTASLSGAHTICMGSSAQLTAMLTGVGPWDLAWSDGVSTQTIVGINSTPHLFSVTPSSSTTYTLSNVLATCNGTLSGTATVTVNAMPTATISGANTICTGGSTSLSVSFTGTGPWDLGYLNGASPVSVNGITSNPYVFSVTPSSTRNYTLSSIFATCSGLVSGNVTVAVNPIPTAMLTGNQTICTGSNANLTLLLSGGAPWDVVLSDGTNTIPFNGINSSPFTAVTAPVVNTSYTVQSVFATCSGNTAGSSTVVVNPVPTASISGGQTICNNYGTTLTFNLTGVGPWNINYTDGVSPFNINGITNPVHIITVSPSASRTYSLSSVFATCNGSVSGTAAIGVTNPPFGFMTGNRTLCLGDSSRVQVGLSGFGPWNITYSTGSGNVTVTGITSSPYQFGVTPTSTRYFSMVSVSSNCPGTPAGNATLVVNPVPSASFTSSYLPVCTGQGRQVQVNLTGVQPWSITYTDGVTPVTLNNITSSPYTFTVNPVAPETYTLTNVNATCNGTFGNASVLVQPESAPTATLSGTQTVCILTPATLSVNFTGTGPWNIVYTDGANNYSVNGLTANPSTFQVPMGATQKTINLVSVTGACAGLVNGTAAISVTNKPVAVMSAPSGMCLGMGGQLSVSISGLGPWDLTYTDGTNFYTENAIASSPYSWTVNPTGNTTYQLTNLVSPHCTGSVLSTPVSVPVSIQPTATLTGVQTICSGNVANLTLNMTGQAPWTAVYSNGTNSFVLSGLTADTVISVMPMSTTTYSLTTVATNGCIGVSTGNEEVVVIPNVTSAVAGADQTICSNAFTLNGNIPGVGTGQWQVVQGTGTLNDSSLYNANVGNLSVGTNVLVWQISSGICVSTSQITIEVTVPPTTANAGTDQYLCGTSTVLNGNTPVNGIGTWTVLSGMGTLVDPNDANSPVNNLLLGHTVMEWTIVTGGCTSSSIVNVYAALSAPATSAGQDQLICSSATSLNAMTPTVGTGIWVRASGSGVIQDTLDAQTPVNGLSMGLNSFVWITQNAGCYATDTVQVQVVQAPAADFMFTQFGFDVDFADISQGGSGSYSWTFGDGGISSNQNPHHTYMQAGVYPVRLIITNVCRSDTAYDTVRIGGVKNNDFTDSSIGIELYPNPASSGYVEMKVNGIYGDQVTVRIYNMLGSEVLTREIATEGRESFTQRIELGTLLSKGTYTVILETEKGIKSEKLVVL